MPGTSSLAHTAGLLLALNGPMLGATRAHGGTDMLAQKAASPLHRNQGSQLTEMPITAATELPTPQFWLSVLRTSAARLAELEAGWDGFGAQKISRAALPAAVRATESSMPSIADAVPPYLVPIANGGVQIEWHEEHGELEYCLNSDGSRYIWIKNHLTGVEIEGDDEEAVAIFYRWAPWVATAPVHADHVSASPTHTFFSIAA